MVILQKSLKKLQQNATYRITNTKQCGCGYRSLQTFERPRNETSNVETQFVDKELINNHPHFSINKSGQSHF
jgi:hypothetical protein